MHLPKPPREPHHFSSVREEERRDNRRGRAEQGRRHERQGARDDAAQNKSSQSRGSCNARPFSWPSIHDDDDEDYHHPGQGDAKFSEGYWGIQEVRREHTRSPPCRNYGSTRGSLHDLGKHVAVDTGGVNLDAFMPPAEKLSKSQLQALFTVRAHGPKTTLRDKVLSTTNTTNPLTAQMNREACLTDAEAYVLKATHLAARLGIKGTAAGEQAWSDIVPVKHVFSRLPTA